MTPRQPTAWVTGDRVALAVERRGKGPPVLLLHGLTATRRYVVMGSGVLERSGYDVIAYDARAHGQSSPAPEPSAYRYLDLVADALALLERLQIDRAVLAGASMGAHTALALALAHPERVAGLVVITPGYDPDEHDDPERLVRWDALADGLRRGGVDGFLAAYGHPPLAERWVRVARTVLRQRLSQHAHRHALADALQAVPRSRPFAALAELRGIAVPTLVVASRDEADPEHPYELARAYARAIPRARVVSERAGASPLAWQGSQLSHAIAALAERAFAR